MTHLKESNFRSRSARVAARRNIFLFKILNLHHEVM